MRSCLPIDGATTAYPDGRADDTLEESDTRRPSAATSRSARRCDHDRDRGPGPLGRTSSIGAPDSVPLLPRPTRPRALGHPCSGAGLSRGIPHGGARSDRRLAEQSALSGCVVPCRRTLVPASRDESCMSGHMPTTPQSRSRARPVDHRRRIEVICTDCGFGAVVTTAPKRCPMCGGSTWRAASDRRTRPPQLERTTTRNVKEATKR
jgi:hypothetical protein